MLVSRIGKVASPFHFLVVETLNHLANHHGYCTGIVMFTLLETAILLNWSKSATSDVLCKNSSM